MTLPLHPPFLFFHPLSLDETEQQHRVRVQVRVEVDKLNVTQVAAHNLSATLMFPKGHSLIDFLCGPVMSSIRDARS